MHSGNRDKGSQVLYSQRASRAVDKEFLEINAIDHHQGPQGLRWGAKKRAEQKGTSMHTKNFLHHLLRSYRNVFTTHVCYLTSDFKGGILRTVLFFRGHHRLK